MHTNPKVRAGEPSGSVLVSAEGELDLIAGILRAEGVPDDAAWLQALWLLEADLRGHPSHGIQRLPVIVARIRRGFIDPLAAPQIEWVSSGAARVDGRKALGPVAGTMALDAAVERARRSGVATAAVSNANHLGLLAPYVEQAAEAGLIAIALTTSEALVHPWGGALPLIGTNPLAIAVPAAPVPFVMDMATSGTSMGRVLDHRHRGVPLAEGWAVDSIGEPTTDPHAAAALTPFGGPKGYALALAIELVVAALTGSALGTDVTGTLDTVTTCNKGDLFVALDPQAFGMSATDPAITTYLEEVASSPAAPGSEGVSIPGEGARGRRRRHGRDGIEIPVPVWREIMQLRRAEAA